MVMELKPGASRSARGRRATSRSSCRYRRREIPLQLGPKRIDVRPEFRSAIDLGVRDRVQIAAVPLDRPIEIPLLLPGLGHDRQRFILQGIERQRRQRRLDGGLWFTPQRGDLRDRQTDPRPGPGRWLARA